MNELINLWPVYSTFVFPTGSYHPHTTLQLCLIEIGTLGVPKGLR